MYHTCGCTAVAFLFSRQGCAAASGPDGRGEPLNPSSALAFGAVETVADAERSGLEPVGCDAGRLIGGQWFSRSSHFSTEAMVLLFRVEIRSAILAPCSGRAL